MDVLPEIPPTPIARMLSPFPYWWPLLLILVVLGMGGLVWYVATSQQVPNRSIMPHQDSEAATTPATAAGKITIVAAGDVACNGEAVARACRQATTANLIEQIQPKAVLGLGDLQYDRGELVDFQKYFAATWGKFQPILYPAPGNHEYQTKDAAGYFDYFNGVGAASGRAGDRDKGYYSVDIGTWHVIALNSNCLAVGGCQKGSAQEQWLRQDLTAHPATCTLAFWHHPRFSSGKEHGSNVTYRDFWQTLYDAGVDVVLAGHEHNYERFMPMRADGVVDAKRGIREFVVGTGGRSLYAFDTPVVGSEMRNNTTFGVLRLALGANSYEWEFMGTPESSFKDVGNGQCH